jgi:hypothetical protein
MNVCGHRLHRIVPELDKKHMKNVRPFFYCIELKHCFKGCLDETRRHSTTLREDLFVTIKTQINGQE